MWLSYAGVLVPRDRRHPPVSLNRPRLAHGLRLRCDEDFVQRPDHVVSVATVHKARELLEPRGLRGSTRPADRRHEGVPLLQRFTSIQAFTLMSALIASVMRCSTSSLTVYSLVASKSAKSSKSV